ncbi:PQQ-binding-like beta-propeller repeat protein [Actinoplanes sp. CA-030573]|uniref:outer membrane protein assembly factor BamB family protein n=1 Tax=Actinoplanes sp. CA-030573 TaxID=3239898 RepID=UPI003D94F70F
MSTIELGEISSAPGEEPVREFDLRTLRRLTIAVVGLLCLLGVTASARPEPPGGVRRLWSVPFADQDNATLGADSVYLSRSAGGRTRLTAYELASGKVRWETTLDGVLGYPQPAEPDGLLLLPADTEVATHGEFYAQYAQQTVALDTRTGRALWTEPGDSLLVARGAVLMADHGDDGGYSGLRLIRLRDRSTVWQRPTPGAISVAFALDGAGPERVITATSDGLIEILRFADGGRIAAARIPWARPDPERGQWNDLTAGGDHLVVNRNVQGHAELSVYRLDSMTERWHADGTDGYAFPCGASICVNNAGGLTAYEADSGRLVWRLPGIGSGWAPSAERVVVSDPDGGRQYLVDTATGQRVGADVTGETVWRIEPGTALLVLKGTTAPPDRTSITRWDLATGRRELLGSTERIAVNRCQAVGHYLGCYVTSSYTVTAVGR